MQNGHRQNNDPPPFEIIHFTKEESEGNPVKHWLIDFIVFASFSAIGCVLTLQFFLGERPSDSDYLTVRQFLASIFLAVGLIPLLQFLGFDVLARFIYHLLPESCGTACSNWYQKWSSKIKDLYGICECICGLLNDKHRRVVHGTLIIIVSYVFIIAAFSLGFNPGEPSYLEIGKAFIEVGLMTGITRVFFFFPNEREEREKLEKDVKDLESSMARGLADGYFWNFVKLVAEHVKEENEDKEDPQPFLIIVPRTMEEWNEHLIKNYIQSKRNTFIPDKFMDTRSSRPIHVTKVIHSDEKGQEEILIDIPTTVTSIIMRVTDENQKDDGDNRKKAKALKEEVNIFTNRIAWLLNKHKYEKYVAVVEVDDLLNFFSNNNFFPNNNNNNNLDNLTVNIFARIHSLFSNNARRDNLLLSYNNRTSRSRTWTSSNNNSTSSSNKSSNSSNKSSITSSITSTSTSSITARSITSSNNNNNNNNNRTSSTRAI